MDGCANTEAWLHAGQCAISQAAPLPHCDPIPIATSTTTLSPSTSSRSPFQQISHQLLGRTVKRARSHGGPAGGEDEEDAGDVAVRQGADQCALQDGHLCLHDCAHHALPRLRHVPVSHPQHCLHFERLLEGFVSRIVGLRFDLDGFAFFWGW